MKFNFLYLLFISTLILTGCDDDSPTASTVDCTSLMSDMMEKSTTYSTNFLAGTATQVECETAFAAMQAYCDGSCEPADTAPEESSCVQEDLDAGSAFCSTLP